MHHATDATWSKWVALITQRARMGNPRHPEILEVIMYWPEGNVFRVPPVEDVTHEEEVPLYNKLLENEKSDNGTHFRSNLIDTWAKNMVLSGCITSPTMHQPLERSNRTMGH